MEFTSEEGQNLPTKHSSYEDLNSLLMNLSPGYQQYFNNKLFEKLN